MREILFKARRKDNREWVEGCLITDELSNAAFIGYAFGTNNGILHDTDLVEVDPDTVCQYTGLTDKNGKKIFEGDIISFDVKMLAVNIHREYEVSWENGGFKLFCSDGGFIGDEVEVIGNIHDNES